MTPEGAADTQKGDGSTRIGALAPGILVAATGVGAGDLATAALAGGRLGTAVLWAVLLGAGLKLALNEGLARWQLATGSTLLEGLVAQARLPLVLLFGPYLLLWTFFVGAALISACGIAAAALLSPLAPTLSEDPAARIALGALHSALGAGLVWVGGFRLFERVMAVCIGIMFAVVTVTAALLAPDLGAVVRGLLVPSIPDAGGEGLSWTVALLGGVGGTLTVLCYGYWIREAGRTDLRSLAACRRDLGAGYAMTAVFGLAMVIIGNTLPVDGGGAGLVVALAGALEGPLGPVGRWAFLVGAWGAIFSSLLGVWQSVPTVFADVFYGVTRRARPERLERSLPYRLYLAALALIPIAGALGSFARAQKLYAVVGAAFLPLLAVALLVLNNLAAPPAARNRWPSNAALLGCVLFFAWAALRGIG